MMVEKIALTVLLSAACGVLSFIVSYSLGRLGNKIAMRKFKKELEALEKESIAKIMKLQPIAYWKGKRGDFTCSNCGEEAPDNGYYAAPYCYECGAMMPDADAERLEEEGE